MVEFAEKQAEDCWAALAGKLSDEKSALQLFTLR
jgi:hypothetical protein